MRTAFLTAMLALSLGAPAAAQDGEPREQVEDIIVTGTPEDAAVIRDFVRTLTGPSNGTDPIARLDAGPICPGVVGLSAERNAAIAARMRQVAAAANLEVAQARDCRPNALVILTRNRDEMVNMLRRQHSEFFRDGANMEVEIPDEPGPVAAWHVERMVDSDGLPVAYDEINGYYVVNNSRTPSRINANARRLFIAAVVVIQVDALVGLSPTQIADYAAMRAYAQVDPTQVQNIRVPTILTAIQAPEGSAVPLTLTHWDLSYLRALASTPALNFGNRQRTDLRRRMMQELEAAHSGEQSN